MNRLFIKIKKNYINLNININTLFSNVVYLNVRGNLGILEYQLKFPFFLYKNFVLYINYKYKNFFFKFLESLIFYVTYGFSICLSIHGLGIRASLFENYFFFDLGYSHICEYNFNQNLKFQINNGLFYSMFQNIIVKFYSNCFIVKGINFNFISNLCSYFRHSVKLNSYRLKGLVYIGEVPKFKIGKRD